VDDTSDDRDFVNALLIANKIKTAACGYYFVGYQSPFFHQEIPHEALENAPPETFYSPPSMF